MNNSIIYVGMDVHTSNYTLTCFSLDKDDCFATVQVAPDVKNILKYLKRVEENLGYECHFICGYEAGCLGYSLYNQLKKNNIECIIMAPTSLPAIRNEIKTDRRDAEKLAKCLAFKSYSPVHVPNEHDNAIKDFIRMRDDVKAELKRAKQHLIALCLREGLIYKSTNYWTKTHIEWLRKLKFSNYVLEETFNEYLLHITQLIQKVERLDNRIEELSKEEKYLEKVNRLCCFMGISRHKALSLIVETGDFKRFKKAQNYAAFLGLVPGESSSGNTIQRLGITKAGNTHLRRLLVESAQSVTKINIHVKSRKMQQKQINNSPEIIAYADKANIRMKKKYIRMTQYNNIKSNIAKTAIARELACFVWGMMNDKIY
jgi:transposase